MSFGINGKILWSGTMEFISIDEEDLIACGMTEEEAHRLMLGLIQLMKEERENAKTER